MLCAKSAEENSLPESIRVAIAAPYPSIRQSIKNIFYTHGRRSECVEFDSFHALEAEVQNGYEYDLIVIDTGIDGLSLSSVTLESITRGTNTVFLAASIDRESVLKAKEIGAISMLPLTEARSDVAAILINAVKGKSNWKYAFTALRSYDGGHPGFDTLTDKQGQVVELVSKGRVQREEFKALDSKAKLQRLASQLALEG